MTSEYGHEVYLEAVARDTVNGPVVDCHESYLMAVVAQVANHATGVLAAA
jgi:hypothetical protein